MSEDLRTTIAKVEKELRKRRHFSITDYLIKEIVDELKKEAEKNENPNKSKV